jgi:hypothetical protein
MSTKSLFLTGASLAASCLLVAGDAQAQSPYNPFTWFAPQPAYKAAPYCPNGNCGVVQAKYYQPAYANCPGGVCNVPGNCAGGNCNVPMNCVNGVCAPKSPYGYPTTLPYNGARTPSYYAPVNPVYPTQPALYNTYRPVSGWNGSSMANSPFYP